MCGIAGFVGHGSASDLNKMSEAIAHRGPDDNDTWIDYKKKIFLAHRRLSVVDIKGGRQPMWDAAQNHCVIYNGEIYNHRELRTCLEKRGYHFQTDHSDTEILLHGFLEWGFGLPNRLNGMWAFALYDKQKQLLFLSRDRFGNKPLFYCCSGNTFAFASELSALTRHKAINPSISFSSLKKYFAYGFVPAPNTLYDGIYKLAGGHNLIYDLRNSILKILKYWHFKLEPQEDIPKNATEIWSAELRELLSRATKRRLISDVPLGVFLSGGIDSSSITAFAAEKSEKPVKTFTIGFHDSSFNETPYARMVASYFKTDHHEKMFSITQQQEILDTIAGKLDEPIADSSLLPTFMLSREAKQFVTVALGGDGGDELFAGYDPFKALFFAKCYQKMVPKPVHQGLLMAISRLPVSHRRMSIDFILNKALTGLSYPEQIWNPIWIGPLSPDELDAIFAEPTDIEAVYSEAIECWDDCSTRNLIDKTLQFYTKLYLQNDILVKTDRAGMLNSIEVRAPFLDIDLVDFIRKIPYQWKYRNGQTKFLLKKAMAPVLPEIIINRSKKGFGAPVAKWFKADSLGFDTPQKCEVFDSSVIANMLNKHKSLKKNSHQFLWGYWLLMEFL
jgi:asparagine synthase (glutamine-hydrolysing)